MLRAATVNFYYCPIVPSSCHRLWADIQGVNQCCLDVILRHFGSRWSKTPFKEKGTGPVNPDSCISSLFHVQSPYMEVLLSWCDDSGCFTVSGGSAAAALCTVTEPSSAWTVCISVWSDASLVTVEGCDMKHVAVCANSDRFHLTISGQRSRMRGAARAKDLKRQYIHYQLPYIWTICESLLYRHNSPKFGLLAQANKPSHSFYSGASCEWRWKELCRQCKSCRLHQAPNLEDLQRANSTVNTTGTCHQSSFCPASRKMSPSFKL